MTNCLKDRQLLSVSDNRMQRTPLAAARTRRYRRCG